MIEIRGMNLLRKVLIGEELEEIITELRDLIQIQRAELKRSELDAVRGRLNILLNWRLWLEDPEEDPRDKLDAAIQDLADQAARLEEHSC